MSRLLEIKNLSVSFQSENETTDAVKDVSFHVNRGEVVALVGESGSGKSVTALSILRLLSSSAQFKTGELLFSETGNEQLDLLKLNKKQIVKIRGEKLAMIFQEPMTSLNPVFTCGYQVAEAIQKHKK